MTQAQSSAGGAPVDQIIVLTTAITALFAVLAYVIWREGIGRPTVVGRLADRIAECTATPRWLALPIGIQIAAIVTAGIGVYWDVAYHFNLGRDEGPLANPSHYLIMVGLLGFLASGGVALGLARDPLPRRTVRLGPGWRVPYGAVLITVSALFGFAAFPMDDVWHRLFGQDVTLWGPTHIVLIGGALFSFVGLWVLCAEAEQVSGESWVATAGQFVSASMLLLAFNAYTMEYDHGAAQFPLLAHPVVLTLAFAIVLPAALIRLGRARMVAIVVLFLVLRVVLMVLVGTILGRSAPHFPLALVEALVVLAAAAFTRHRFAFGALAGAGIGTVGMLAEHGWTRAFGALVWPSSLIGLWLPLCAVLGAAAGVLSCWVAGKLTDTSSAAPAAPAALVPEPVHGGRLALVALAVVVGVLGWVTPPTATTAAAGTVLLEDTSTGPDRHAVISIRLDRPEVADGALWFTALAWQGGGLEVTNMAPVGDGTYRAERPMPVHGNWKTVIRLHRAPGDLVAAPVYFPPDPAIPVDGIAAESGQRRAFVAEKLLLRREEKLGVPDWMWTLGYGVVGLVMALLVGSVATLLSRAAAPVAPCRDRAKVSR